MESRQYKFNESTLTVKFGNILESHADVIVSSDDCYVTMGGGVSYAMVMQLSRMLGNCVPHPLVMSL